MASRGLCVYPPSGARRSGFTIVELLIVIVVIGILAAITIVAYNGVQDRANDTVVQSDLNNLAKKIELAKAYSSTGTYPTSFTASMGLKVSAGAYDTSNNNLYYCLNKATDQYAIGVRSKSGNSFYYKSAGGVQQSDVGMYGESTCNLVGLSWNTAETVSILGYNYSNGSGWASWLNE